MEIKIQKYKNKLVIRADSIETLNFIDRNFAILAHENVKFIPAVKEHRWDGKIRFLSKKSTMRIGLLDELLRVCKAKNIKYAVDFKLKNEISEIKIKEWIKTLNLPFELRDYQYNVFLDLLKFKNISIQSEMGSGKSLIIYLVLRFMLENDFKTMLIVPNIDLLYQMKKDFISYGWLEHEKYLQIIGDKFIKKEFQKPVIISTWQSLQAKRMKLYNQVLYKRQKELLDDLVNLSELEKNNKTQVIIHNFKRLKRVIGDYLNKGNINLIKKLFINSKDIFCNYREVVELIDSFEQNITEEFNTIDCVMGDECDTCTGDALNHLLDKFEKSKFRLGLTGTMPIKEYADWYTIVSNFGKFDVYNTYRELADRGDLSDISIIVNYLKYSNEEKKLYHENVVRSNYRSGLYYISNIEKRNQYIIDQVNNIKNENVLLLFQFKEGEGHNYFKHFKDIFNRKLIYIDGDIKDRDKIVTWMKNTTEKYICLGSVKTMSRGINIPNLQHIFLLSSFRNREGLFQAVGRLSRLFGNNKAKFHDLVDNFVMEDEFGRLKVNMTIEHYYDRLAVYKERQYKIEEKYIDLL